MRHNDVLHSVTEAIGSELVTDFNNEPDLYLRSAGIVGDMLGMSPENWADIYSFPIELTDIYCCMTTLYIVARLGLTVDDLFDPSEMPDSIDVLLPPGIPEVDLITLAKPWGYDRATIEMVCDRLQERGDTEGLENMKQRIGCELKPLLSQPIASLQIYSLAAVTVICTAVECNWLSVLRDLHQRYLEKPDVFPTPHYLRDCSSGSDE